MPNEPEQLNAYGYANSGYYFTWTQPTNAPSPFGTTPEIGYGDAEAGVVPGL